MAAKNPHTVLCVAGDKHGTTSGYTNRKCRCGECSAAKSEYDRQRYAANREQVLERNRLWRENNLNPETNREHQRRYREANREHVRDKQRRYREANREHVREANRRYRENNPEAKREQNRLWAKNNPDTKRAYSQARRARERDAFVEVVLLNEVLERDGWICHICLDPISQSAENDWPNPYSPSLDHVVALVNGGEHSYENCSAAHLRCNQKKGAR